MVIYSLLAVQKVMINDKVRSRVRIRLSVTLTLTLTLTPNPSPNPNPNQHCFEMYGYDVMIDDNLKPWLIEVNSSPSITADTPTDYELKFGLLDDVYTIIDVEGKLGGAVEPVVGGFDLVYNNGPVKPSPSPSP